MIGVAKNHRDCSLQNLANRPHSTGHQKVVSRPGGSSRNLHSHQSSPVEKTCPALSGAIALCYKERGEARLQRWSSVLPLTGRRRAAEVRCCARRSDSRKALL